MLMPNFNILEILTFTTALIFSTFSVDWSAKVYTSEALLKIKVSLISFKLTKIDYLAILF